MHADASTHLQTSLERALWRAAVENMRAKLLGRAKPSSSGTSHACSFCSGTKCLIAGCGVSHSLHADPKRLITRLGCLSGHVASHRRDHADHGVDRWRVGGRGLVGYDHVYRLPRSRFVRRASWLKFVFRLLFWLCWDWLILRSLRSKMCLSQYCSARFLLAAID